MTSLELQRRLRENPSDLAAQLDLARACLRDGQPGDALFYLRLVEGSASRRGEVRHLMGLAHLDCGDVPEAVMDLMAAARALPGDADVAAALDRALEQLTDPGFEEQGEIASDEATPEWLDRHVTLQEDAAAELTSADAAHPAGTEEAAGEALPQPSSSATPVEDQGAVAGRSEAPDAPDATSAIAEPASAGHVRPLLDIAAVRQTLGRPPSAHQAAAPKTILLKGQATQTRKTALWTAAFFVMGALAFGVIATYRQRQPGPSKPAAEARPGASVPLGALPPAPVLEPESLEGESAVSEARGSTRGADESARDQAVAPGESGDSESSTVADSLEPSADPATVAIDGGESSPLYEFMARLGLGPPPGGILDPQDSDPSRLMREALPAGRDRAAVLTFRTGASVQEVVDHYEEQSGSLRFNQRVVPMGGKYQGVQRSVARARGRVGGGREVTITVSRPGIDRASKVLTEDTSVRLEIR